MREEKKKKSPKNLWMYKPSPLPNLSKAFISSHVRLRIVVLQLRNEHRVAPFVV
jgi:hypothetical protein